MNVSDMGVTMSDLGLIALRIELNSADSSSCAHAEVLCELFSSPLQSITFSSAERQRIIQIIKALSKVKS